jgi:hypothetical protein
MSDFTIFDRCSNQLDLIVRRLPILSDPTLDKREIALEVGALIKDIQACRLSVIDLRNAQLGDPVLTELMGKICVRIAATEVEATTIERNLHHMNFDIKDIDEKLSSGVHDLEDLKQQLLEASSRFKKRPT